jgi:hypothetical protein
MKRKKWKTLRIAVMLAPVVGLVTAFPAKADVVYTTFGTSICGGDATCIANNGINQNYDAVDGPSNTISPFETEMIADSFTPTANFTLSDVQLVLQNLGQGDANVYLTSDSGGTPGAVLESWITPGEPFALTQLNALTLTSVATPTLTAGTQYWLVVAPNAKNSAVGYNYSWNVDISGSSQLFDATPGPGGFATLASAPGNWFPDGPGLEAAFRIDGTPTTGGGGGGSVPETSSLGFFGIGALGLLAIASRKRRSAEAAD